MSTITIKADFQSDIRRFSIPKNSSFDDLQSVLKSLYGCIDDDSFYCIKYFDEDSDLISVTNDVELSEAIFAHTDKPLRVSVCIQKTNVELPVSLFNSWVILLSEAKDHLIKKQQKEDNLDEVLEEFHIIEDKIKLSTQAITTPKEKTIIKTPTGDNNEEEQHVPIKELVMLLSKEISENMVILSSKIAKLVSNKETPNEDEYTHVNKVLLQAQSLAAECLDVCSKLSKEALNDVTNNSNSILKTVSLNSNLILAILNHMSDNNEQKEIIRNLSNDTLNICTVLSKETLDQCMSDSDNIVNLINKI